MALVRNNSINGREPMPSLQDTIPSPKPPTEPVRPLANYLPSEWGDRFTSFSLDNSALEAYAKALEGPKEEVRSLIIDSTVDVTVKLSLIYSVIRLGLSYLFPEEIDAQLHKLFKEVNLKDYEKLDLYTISLHFQVFRHQGYKLPCDVFNRFKDESLGTFKEAVTSDVEGMLGLYEAAHLRVHGEDILDEALDFTQAELKKVVGSLDGIIARQVKQALKRPFHYGMVMVEARLYFSIYEEASSSDGSLIKLAKIHFNYLQLLHKEELRIVSQWWEDRKFIATFPYIRDRVPESYLWSLGTYFEPCYAKARIISTKITLLLLVIDDTYDVYATIEEDRLLTDSITRWTASAEDQLPEYIKPFYKILLDEYDQLEKEYSKAGRAYSVHASKLAFKELARGYLQEAEWLKNGYVPSFPEYMKNGLITSTYDLLSKSALVGMGNIGNEEAVAWFESHPKILQAIELIGRLENDLMSFQFERKILGLSVTGVDAYIKDYSVSEEVAIKDIRQMIQNAWKDINEGWLKPTEASVPLLALMLNLARVLDAAYRFEDAFTFPERTFKVYTILLFLTPA